MLNIGRNTLRLGIPSGRLALSRAYEVRDGLLRAHPSLRADAIEILALDDTDARDKNILAGNMEEALRNDVIDVAIYSMKDVPPLVSDGFEFVAILERQDAREAFVSSQYPSIRKLPRGSVVGVSSLRRRMQLKQIRPDLETIDFDGSIPTRLSKLKTGEAAATFLTVAGLKNMGKEDLINEIIPPRFMLPAAAQGAIGIQCYKNHEEILKIFSRLNHDPTAACVEAERSFLKVFEDADTTPLAAFAVPTEEGRLYLKALVARSDGSLSTTERQGELCDASMLGNDAGQALRCSV